MESIDVKHDRNSLVLKYIMYGEDDVCDERGMKAGVGVIGDGYLDS